MEMRLWIESLYWYKFNQEPYDLTRVRKPVRIDIKPGEAQDSWL